MTRYRRLRSVSGPHDPFDGRPVEGLDAFDAGHDDPGLDAEFDDDFAAEFDAEFDADDEDGFGPVGLFRRQGVVSYLPNGSDPVVAERLAVLRTMDAAGIARVLEASPVLAAAVAGQGPLAYVAPAKPDLASLARLLGASVGVGLAVAGLTPMAARLAEVAVWYGGSLDLATARREMAPLDDQVVRSAADELVVLLLSDPGAAFVHLREGVVAQLPSPGVGVRALLDARSGTSSAQLDQRLRSLGVRAGTTRSARLDALEGALRDPDVVRAALRALSAEARAAFDVILAAGRPTPVRHIGVPYYMGSYGARSHRPGAVLDELVDRSLVYADVQRQTCVVLLDVAFSLRGRLFDEWAAPVVAPLRALHGAPVAPLAPGRLQLLIERSATEPIAGLKNGELGVRAVRLVARRMGLPEDDAVLLGALASCLGLLVPTRTELGRGRKATVEVTFGPGSAAVGWERRSLAARWTALVAAFLDGRESNSNDYAAAPGIVRRTLVGDLAGLPPGCGIQADALGSWACSRRLLYEGRGPQLDDAVAGLRALGLVPADGPVGLTDAGRVLLRAPAGLTDLLANASRSFTVQPDHSVITPPDLDPDIVTQLERLAVLASSGAARVYRLDSKRISAQLATGVDPDEIVGFLRHHSDTPVADGVVRLVDDVARTGRGLVAHEAGCVITAPDATALAGITGVRAAKLTIVAPTVAVSPLPLPKVLALLRAAGLPVLDPKAPVVVAGPAPRAPVAPGAMAVVAPPLPASVQPDAAALAALLAPHVAGPKRAARGARARKASS